MEQTDRGEYLELDEAGIAELAKDVHRRGLARLAQLRKNPDSFKAAPGRRRCSAACPAE
jgi:hypothetical protein